MMSPMRGRPSTVVGLLVSASLIGMLFCPCAMAPAPAANADAHGCCPVETGLRAAAPGCCAANTAPEPGTAAPPSAGPTAPLLATSVLAPVALPARLLAEAPHTAAAPPLVLRI